MPPKKPRNKDGPPAGLPRNSLLIPLEDPRSQISAVPFPGVNLRIHMPYKPEIEIILATSPYVILGHILGYQDGEPVTFEVGVLGLISAVEKTEKMFAVHITALFRVKIKDVSLNDEIMTAQWQIITEKKITPEEFASPQIQEKLTKIVIMTKVILKNLERDELDFSTSSAETLGVTIDRFAFAFNQILHGKVTEYLRRILAEKNVHLRLDLLLELAEFIRKIPRPIHSIKTADRNNTPPTGDRKLVKEELALLTTKEVTPRFPPVENIETLGSQLVELALEKDGPLAKKILEFASQRIIAQPRAIEAITGTLVLAKTGLTHPRRPLGKSLFCGGTGLGKSESARMLAEFLFGDPDALTKVSLETMPGDFTATVLTGSPPGYVGSVKMHKLSQWNLDKYHVFKLLREGASREEYERIMSEVRNIEQALGQDRFIKQDTAQLYSRLRELTGWRPGEHFAVVLFDEIEKANMAVLLVLLGILNDGTLTLLNGEEISFRNTIVIMTSNIYGRELADQIAGRNEYGIRSRRKKVSFRVEFEQTKWKETLDALRKFLPPELLGRIGKENIVVFYPFEETDLTRITNLIIWPEFFMDLKETAGITVFLSEDAKEFVVKESYDDVNRSLGARALESVLEQRVKKPIGRMLDLGGEEGLMQGDRVLVDAKDKPDGSGKKIVIKREERRSS